MDQNSDKLNLDNLAEDAPLMHLIGRQPHEMTDEMLDAHLAQLRVLQTSAPTRRAAVKKAPKPKGVPGKDFSRLFK